MATTTSTTPAAAAAATGFALGIAPEDKLSMPLDALIKSSKAENKAKAAATANAAGKKAAAKKSPKATAASPVLNKKQKQKQKKVAARQLLNVKKTVTVPVSKAARARATTKASSTKRQAEINKRRPGLVVASKAAQTARNAPVQTQVRRQQTSALRVARAATGPASAAGKRRQAQRTSAPTLDVSNIQRHFATHPSKFDLPKGTNLRITINLNKVKPVVGTKK